jgi:hypothetical protein
MKQESPITHLRIVMARLSSLSTLQPHKYITPKIAIVKAEISRHLCFKHLKALLCKAFTISLFVLCKILARASDRLIRKA